LFKGKELWLTGYGRQDEAPIEEMSSNDEEPSAGSACDNMKFKICRPGSILGLSENDVNKCLSS
jgi:hypothetical protein